MHDDVSRLLGIEGMAVTGVADHGWRLELEVETLAGVGCCRWCGRGSLKVKERDRVRVRDLPGAGRMTYLCWCKRQFWCEAWRADVYRDPPGAAVPSTGQCSRSRSRSWSLVTSCWPGVRMRRRSGCRSMRPITVVAGSWRLSSLSWMPARDRRHPGMHPQGDRAVADRAARRGPRRDRGGLH